jgi:DNA (cytosine-5)-methyltransferase 1
MNVVSLFSGVGGFDLGLEAASMKTIYQCEWDKHARSILDRHWPLVPKWGDITTLTATEILRHGQNPDVIAWGSPCQDLSVAGKRAGLEGERSGLFHEGMRIIKELRKETNNAYPRISIWENVAGALSSNRGADFGIILDEMAQAGAMVIEWAMLDAQHFGIPQRRRRVFVIAIFDPATARNCPNPLLPVSESLRGNTAKGKPKGQTTSSQASTSIGGDGEWWDGGTIADALTTTSDAQRMPDKDRLQAIIVDSYTSSSFASYTEGVGTLRSNGGDLGGGSETLIAEPFVKSRRAQPAADDETWVEGQVNPTLNSFDMGDTRSTTAIVEPMLLDGTRVDDVRVYEPPVQTLKERMGTGGNNVPMLAFDTQFGSNANVFEDQSPTLKASQQSPSVAYDEYDDSISPVHHALRAGTKQSTGVLEPTMAVRRLTPLECERLMGWPDDHTRYKADGTEQADTHRYKQCGNGVASPVARWIAQHILNIPKDPAQ